MNFVVVSGRLTQDPEVEESENGTLYLRNAVAVRGRTNDEVTFVNFVAFSKTAEFIEDYLAKGCRVIVTGRLSVNENKYTSIIVNNIEPIDWAMEDAEEEDEEYEDDEYEYEDEDEEWEEEEE